MPEIDNIGNGSSGSFDAVTGSDIDSRASVARQSNRLTVEGTATGNKIYKYPLFLDRGKQATQVDEQARECIRFTVVKQGGASFKNGDLERLRQASIDAGIKRRSGTIRRLELENAFGGPGFAAGEAPSIEEQRARANANNSTISNLRNERADLEQGNIGTLTPEDFLRGGGTQFLRDQQSRTSADPQNLEHCFLYMPPSVIFTEGATWGQEAMGALGNAAKNLIRSKGDVGKILSEFGQGVATPLAQAAAVGAGGAIAGVFGAVATAIGGQGITSGVGAGLRVAQNPYEEQLFQGIPFRVFNFTFDFVATSYEEFQEVQNIIKMFRSHSRPTFTIERDRDGNQSEALYSYPNEFAISFMHLADDDIYKENKFLPKLHNCVLTNISTNFAPDGWIAHEDGEPINIVVQLAFTETKKNTRVDIERGY